MTMFLTLRALDARTNGRKARRMTWRDDNGRFCAAPEWARPGYVSPEDRAYKAPIGYVLARRLDLSVVTICALIVALVSGIASHASAAPLPNVAIVASVASMPADARPEGCEDFRRLDGTTARVCAGAVVSVRDDLGNVRWSRSFARVCDALPSVRAGEVWQGPRACLDYFASVHEVYPQ